MNSWKIINDEVNNYLERILLPDMIAYILYTIFIKEINVNTSLEVIINNSINYVNITDINYDSLIVNIVYILRKKYNMDIVNFNKLKLVYKKHS